MGSQWAVKASAKGHNGSPPQKKKSCVMFCESSLETDMTLSPGGGRWRPNETTANPHNLESRPGRKEQLEQQNVASIINFFLRFTICSPTLGTQMQNVD